MSCDKPLVSVVIPAFNAQDWLGEALSSVLQQTWQNLEIVVIDDGSTDRTSQVAAAFSPRVRCIQQVNSGQAKARNTGIESTTGEYIAFLDSDDMWMPNKIESQIDLMSKDPKISLIFCDYESFGPIQEKNGFCRSPVLANLSTSSPTNHGRVLTLPEPSVPLLQDMYCQVPSTWLIRRSALERSGAFDVLLKTGAEDWLFAVRLAVHGKLAYDTRMLAMRRAHPGSHSRMSDHQYALVLAMERLLRFQDLPKALRDQVRTNIALTSYHLANSLERTDARRSKLRKMSLRFGIYTPPMQGVKILARALATAIK